MEERRILLLDDPCPCGSGLSLVQCCFKEGRALVEPRFGAPAYPINSIPPGLAEQVRKDSERQARFGKTRPLIHADWQGKKWVAVGEHFYWGNWRFFPDFLQFYIKLVMTPAWGNSEIQKPIGERHPVMQWYDAMCRMQQELPRDSEGNTAFLPDGATNAYMLLAYDLYALRHHQLLQSVVVNRLKRVDQFQGARYELFVAATCIRAGFDIEYENEHDGTRKHSEFVAISRKTNVRISVEAKSRHRPGVLGREKSQQTLEERPIGIAVGRLLRKAIEKSCGLPHIVFIDVNTPPEEGTPFESPWFKEVMAVVEIHDPQIGGGSARFNLVVFTNHPFHYAAPGVASPSPETISVMARNPLVPLGDLTELHSIHTAALQFGRIPQHFKDAD